ncbi:MAG TPA: DEAD/DEAH box helicase [Clostridiales bacterium]|nr:DEAD/DEAH box helicase [Clostridiales bacterium]
MSNFRELGLSEPILKALNEMGFEEPTEVQKLAIPPALNGRDVIVMSKTGSGKTAVFGVSILQMTDPSDPGPQCLILVPTRELAVQVNNDLKKMAMYTTHQTMAVYGQHNINTEIRELKQNITIVTGTPGRVYDHIQNGNLDTSNIHFLVLDEVDRMMDMGFIDQVRRIIRTLPKNRTTLLFSATIPEEVRRLCQQYMNDPVNIEIQSATRTVDTIEQIYYRVEKNEKRTQLNRLLLMEQPETCMIFCNTKAAVDQVQNHLAGKGYASRALHGDIPQSKRMKNIQQFKQGDYHILVATDVAARGIHVEDLSLVINYDVPNELDSYIHRVGRTGRAGQGGRAISLVTTDDLMTLYQIEEHIGTLIPEAPLPTDEELAERSESAEEWIKANAIKNKPGYQAAKKRTGGSKSRSTGIRSTDGKVAGCKSGNSRKTDDICADSRSSAAKSTGGRNAAENRKASSGLKPSQKRSSPSSQHARSGDGRRNEQGKAGFRAAADKTHTASYMADNRQNKRTRPDKNTAMDANIKSDRDTRVSKGAGQRTSTAPPNAANAVKTEKPQETAAKKSLFKRIFDKILGR